MFYILCSLLVIGCSTENAPDCFQRTGSLVRKKIEVSDFKKILALPNVEIVIKQGETTAVIIESGENLINDVHAEVVADRLILSNTNECNFVRSYNQTKIFITAPEIQEIRSATQFDISSDGVLTYPSLLLISEDNLENNEGSTSGTFTIEVDNDRLRAVGNNIATFFIKGKTKALSVNFASGTGRFEGIDLVAQDISILHRGTNKIIVNPTASLTGEIRSTGNLLSVNKPPMIDIKEFFTGKLLFTNP